MPIFGKCCCCHLKTGNIVLGCLCLIGVLFNLGYAAYKITILNAGNQVGQYDITEWLLAEYQLIQENKNTLLMVSSCMDLIASIMFIPTSICLIVGALKANRQLIALYLVVEMVDIVLIFLKMTIIFFIFGFNYKVLIYCVYVSASSIFIWLFPLSLYQDLQNSSAAGAKSALGAQFVYSRSTPDCQFAYTRSTPDGQFAYEPVPMSMTYPVQEQAYQPPPPYTQKY